MVTDDRPLFHGVDELERSLEGKDTADPQQEHEQPSQDEPSLDVADQLDSDRDTPTDR